MSKIKITVPEGKDQYAHEVIEQAIIDIADGMKRLESSRLKRSAIVTLIHQQSKVARRDIELVLNNLVELERLWLKPKI